MHVSIRLAGTNAFLRILGLEVSEYDAEWRSYKGDVSVALKVDGPCSEELDSKDAPGSMNVLGRVLLAMFFSLFAMKLPFSVSGVAKPGFDCKPDCDLEESQWE